MNKQKNKLLELRNELYDFTKKYDIGKTNLSYQKYKKLTPAVINKYKSPAAINKKIKELTKDVIIIHNYMKNHRSSRDKIIENIKNRYKMDMDRYRLPKYINNDISIIKKLHNREESDPLRQQLRRYYDGLVQKSDQLQALQQLNQMQDLALQNNMNIPDISSQLQQMMQQQSLSQLQQPIYEQQSPNQIQQSSYEQQSPVQLQQPDYQVELYEQQEPQQIPLPQLEDKTIKFSPSSSSVNDDEYACVKPFNKKSSTKDDKLSACKRGGTPIKGYENIPRSKQGCFEKCNYAAGCSNKKLCKCTSVF